MKFRRHKPVRRRRGRKPDVLNFSLCEYEVDVTNDETTPGNWTCDNPRKAIIPLVLGGQPQVSQMGGAGGDERSLWLADRAERGGVVGPFRFQHWANVSEHVNTIAQDTAEYFADVIYTAIVKMEYDLDAYRNTGAVNVAEIPNIIRSTVPVPAGNVASPLSDLSCDALWRGIAQGWSVFADIPAGAPSVVIPIDTFGRTSVAWQPPWTTVRVKRRLKEDEGLFWVTNIVSGQPVYVPGFASYTHAVTQFVYGVAAARIT